MNCADCVHYEVCKKVLQSDCLWFEDKNDFIKLPVHLKDTVYVNTYVDGIKERGVESIECFVKSIRLKHNGKTVTFCCQGFYHSGIPYNGNFVPNSIGKTVFFNEKDAVARANLK